MRGLLASDIRNWINRAYLPGPYACAKMWVCIVRVQIAVFCLKFIFFCILLRDRSSGEIGIITYSDGKQRDSTNISSILVGDPNPFWKKSESVPVTMLEVLICPQETENFKANSFNVSARKLQDQATFVNCGHLKKNFTAPWLKNLVEYSYLLPKYSVKILREKKWAFSFYFTFCKRAFYM